MNMKEMLVKLRADKVEIMLHSYRYSDSMSEFCCKLERDSDGVSLKTEGRSLDPEEAVTEAFNRFYKTASSGVPTTFFGPLIEAPRADDEEIPF